MRGILIASAISLFAAVVSGCSAVPGFQDSGPSTEELRVRVVELERKAVVAELEIDRLRQKVAALEGPGNVKRSVPSAAPAPAVTVAPSRAPTFEPQTRIAPPPEIESGELATPPAEPVDPRVDPATPLPATVLDAASGDARAAYDRAYALYHQGRYLESERAFSGYLDSFASNDLSDNAIYWIGECRLARSDWNGALRAFQEAVERFPTGNKVPDALYKAGQALERLGDRDAARASYETVVERFPQSGAAERAAERLSALR